MVRFARTAILFCWSVYGVDVCFSMPWSFKKWLNILETNSLPLSNQNVSILCSHYISTSALNSLNFSKDPSLDFNAYNHTFLRKSPMKVTKYLTPLINVIITKPYMSECTISKGFVTRPPPPFVRKRSPMLFAFDARFTKQRGYWARNFSEVHIILSCFGVYEHP